MWMLEIHVPTVIRRVVSPISADFVDAGIIGGPPRPGYSPTIYASGPTARLSLSCATRWIDWRVIDARSASRLR